MILRFLYSVLLTIIFTVVSPWFFYQMIRRNKYRNKPLERFGVFPAHFKLSDQNVKRIWFHASSAGEILAAKPVIDAYHHDHPDELIFVSAVTDTGYFLAMEKLNSAYGIFQFPLDLRCILRSMLNQIHPEKIILVETELWPNLICLASDMNIPVAIINGRLSDRSFPRYYKLRFFLKNILSRLTLVSVQSQLDADRFKAIGVDSRRIVVNGNVKFDTASEKSETEVRKTDLKTEYKIPAGWKVITAGSTHPGEETLLLRTFKRLIQQHPQTILILAPRHTERSTEVLKLCSDEGYRVSVWPDGPCNDGGIESPQVVVITRMGVLPIAYLISDMAFVGGSFVPIGGHNILEPAGVSIPMTFGPYISNFKEAARKLLQADAATMVNDTDALFSTLLDWLDHPETAVRMGSNGLNLILQNKGAVQRTLQSIKQMNKDNQRPEIRSAMDSNPTSRIPERMVLKVLSSLYRTTIMIRNSLFDLHIIPVHQSPVPVISIGNISTGGTGKTPCTMMLAKWLRANGFNPAIISRGYKARFGRLPTEVVRNGSSRDYGDEPLLMRRTLDDSIPVIISRNRWRGVMMAERRFHSDCCLLDDGFQHRNLARDMDIVLLGTDFMTIEDRLLPEGRLREPFENLSRAHAIVFSGSSVCQSVENSIKRKMTQSNSHIAFFHGHNDIEGFYSFDPMNPTPVHLPAGSRVGVISAIGNPDRFLKAIIDQDLVVVHTSVFSDHHPITAREWSVAAQYAAVRGASHLITTEKDAIRIVSDQKLDFNIPLVTLRIKYMIEDMERFTGCLLKSMSIYEKTT